MPRASSAEAQLRIAIDVVPQQIWSALPDGTVDFCNARWRLETGLTLEELQGDGWQAMLHPDDRQRVLQAWNHAVTCGIPYEQEERHRMADGTFRWFLCRGLPLRDEQGRIAKWYGTNTDIEALKNAQEALQSSAAHVTQHEALIVRLSTELISCAPEQIDAGVTGALAEIGLFAGVDRSYVFLFDETRARVSNTHEWCAPAVEPEIQHLQNLPVRDYPWVLEQLLRGDVVHVPRVSDLSAEARAERDEWQREFIQSILLVPMKTSDDVVGYVGFDAVRAEKAWSEEFIVLLRVFGEIVFNALSRRRADKVQRDNRRLATSAQRMQSLSRRLVEIREEEQRRLSAELHDQVGQNLAALSINLSLIGGMIPQDANPRLAERLRDSHGLVEKGIAFARDLIAEMRPPALDDYGLLAGLRWYGAQLEVRTGMSTMVEGDEPMPRLTGPVERALFRIAQEALTNTVKHARARRASLGLRNQGSAITLTIADDGAGFDPASVQQPGLHRRWGLMMMRERAEAVGAQLQLESAPGQGTRIVVEVTRAP